ncbi:MULTISPECIES: flagellar basal body rod protein FlgB [unclassified Candidatus Frackibacter]|uniref:flagellar basal body rod protein FlgB n=1 Tax=unclassified Candidatus Frackibacter TaxID=2648818 RepID=UPI000795E0D2|nr:MULTISPECIES: flagellar basal body rod protein FlgB [unclassified Candidatus Frackibacter]KXS45247.1 MAG: flagellar basal-body rod protein FlgB [Candidatus Frackibacter sp. T328-2]SDB99762.1 flagellar basal-body rod protein FlgB [Candidatus Frackibacter sp. WG11]SEM31381.1 flagellar basal-body rod protein FlgB [Candidatus Frackibacter sp. WG12]SFL36319.1 flagellar basal-body rod protein FlgB [Candidatus Frackibacter sp. WG13]
MNDYLSSQTTTILSKALDGIQLRHQAIANNLANVDTPEYKRRDVDFKSELKAALEQDDLKLNKTDNMHLTTNNKISQFKPKVQVENDTSMRNDKNNVDIDYEMAALAKNTLEYQAVTKLLSMKFKNLGNVINKVK